MTLQQRKNALKKLRTFLTTPDQELIQLIKNAHIHNPWFTADETLKAVDAVAAMLNSEDLDHWLVDVKEPETVRTVGLVLAGNIPLVGFHDVLSVLASGHTALIKASSNDKHLIPYLLKKLVELEPGFDQHIIYTEKLERFDAVIATGSNNTSRYFEYYFANVPHIIRKNRNSVAVLSGHETTNELALLGRDIFDYFGFGCRNVSKVFVPEGYDFRMFFESVEEYKNVINHNKYGNNYDYNKSIYLIKSDKHLDNGFLLVKEDERLASPLAVLYYEEYKSADLIEAKINALSEQIQCVVTKEKLALINQKVRFGESQKPKLWDYADGINTLEFLQSL